MAADASIDGAQAGAFTEVILPPGGLITGIAVAPDGTAYAILGVDRVVRSTDAGASWSECAPTGSGYIGRLAIDPSNSALYVPGEDVLRSTDRCTTWSPTGLSVFSDSVGVLGTTVFAGTLTGVWSLTAGTWTAVPTPMDGHDVYDVQVDPVGGRVFIVSDNGIARSLDGGATWALANNGLPGARANFVAINPQQPQTLLTVGGATGENLYRSVDAAATWNLVAGGGFSATFDPADPSYALYCGYARGINASTDGGATFASPDRRSPEMGRSAVLDVAFDGSAVYAATGRGIFRAPDRALAWSEVDTGIAGWSISAILPSADGSLYLGTDAGVLRQTTPGSRWSEGRTGIPNTSTIVGVLDVPGAVGSLMVASLNSVVRSDDSGQTFTSVFEPDATQGYNLRAIALAGSRFIVGTAHGVARADPPWTAFTFQQLDGADHDVHQIRVVDAASMTVVVTTNAGIYVSNDQGGTYAAASTGLPELDIQSVIALPDGSLLAGTNGSGVYRATAPGAMWTASGLASQGITDLAVAGTQVFATTYVGVHVSRDAGMTWQPVPGIEGRQPRRLAVAGSRLLVGTLGHGLYEVPLPF